MCTIKITSYSNLKNNINSFMINRLLIIPARGNSKRILNKNIRLFHKKPMIYYVLDLAKKSKLFKKIHVSTESNKVAKVVNNFGLKIDFMRPKFLSKNSTPVVDVLNYVYKKYDPKRRTWQASIHLLEPPKLRQNPQRRKYFMVLCTS